MKHLIWIMLFVVACAPEKAEEETKIPSIPVAVMTLSSTTFDETISVSAVTEPIHEVKVAAEAPGRVLKAPFEEGGEIKKGALILRVDASLDSARIQLLKNQIANAQRELARTKLLTKEGVATPQQLDQAQSSYDSARLNLKQAQVGIGKTTVRSPMTGIVARKMAEVGEYVGPGQQLAHIVDYDTIVVRASVNESDVQAVGEGTTVSVTIPALNKTVDGKVFRRAIVASDQTRTFPVEIHVDNAAHEILPGMRAQVTIPRKTWENVIVVPRDAVLQGFEHEEAMVFQGSGTKGKAELRTLTLGPARGNQVVVTAGLEVGDQLIVQGHRALVDGTPISISGGIQTPDKEKKDAPDGEKTDEENAKLADSKENEKKETAQ